jgi:hypothetical protein
MDRNNSQLEGRSEFQHLPPWTASIALLATIRHGGTGQGGEIAIYVTLEGVYVNWLCNSYRDVHTSSNSC